MREPLRGLCAALVPALLLLVASAAPPPARAADATLGAPGSTLVVQATGLRDSLGQVLARLFRPGDNLMAHTAWRQATAVIREGGATLEFPGLAPGEYALVVVHDRNGNGIIDHNVLRLPAEPLAFSGHYSMGLFSGLPTFEKLRFTFAPGSETLSVRLK